MFLVKNDYGRSLVLSRQWFTGAPRLEAFGGAAWFAGIMRTLAVRMTTELGRLLRRVSWFTSARKCGEIDGADAADRGEHSDGYLETSEGRKSFHRRLGCGPLFP